jgi:glycosyltransferase involved in cell wall biosynthesis
VDVSLIIPCLDEQETIGICVDKAKKTFYQEGIEAEVVVVDNGSADASVEVAEKAGAKVIFQPDKGYGAAYLKGIEEAKGRYIIMGDGDDTYDFRESPRLIQGLKQGYDLVIGSRFKGNMVKGAMSFSHRYVGNPILTTILNLFFRSKISDAHSGFRAIKKEALKRLDLQTTGMEFASEMIVSALREKLKILEVGITYHPRKGVSKLSPFIDAWRHMRFMLLFSSTWLFIIPGMVFFSAGFLALLLSGVGKLALFGHRFDIHAMVFFAFFALLGFQIVNLGFFAKTYSLTEGFIKQDRLLEKFHSRLNLEKGILIGWVVFISGFSGSVYIFIRWMQAGFGPLNEVRLSLIGLLLMVIGIQTIFSSFFLSLLGLPKKTKH